MRKTKEEAEKTKQALIDSGIEIFSRKLYSDVNISEIAKMAGVTRGAVYWHFKNKAELFKEIHNYVEEETIQTVRDAIAKGNTIYERTFSIFKAILLRFKNDSNLRKISRLMNINQGVFAHEDFEGWHKNYHKDEQVFYSDLIEKITKDTDMETKLEKNKNYNPRHEFIASAAFLHGMIDFITYSEEMEIIDLTETDISKIVNIFLTGLCPVDFGVKNHKTGQEKE